MRALWEADWTPMRMRRFEYQANQVFLRLAAASRMAYHVHAICASMLQWSNRIMVARCYDPTVCNTRCAICAPSQREATLTFSRTHIVDV